MDDVLADYLVTCPPPLPVPDPDEVRALASRIVRHASTSPGSLPVSPGLATKIIDVLERPEVEINQLVRLIHQDVAVSTKILEVANSAVYGGSTSIQTLRGAVVHLGMREVAGIAVTMAGRALFELESRAQFEAYAPLWSRLYHDALTTAFTAGWLAQRLRLPESDRALVGGMLHGIGKPIALRSLSTLLVAGKVARASDGVVESMLEVARAECAALAVKRWHLPAHLVSIAADQGGDTRERSAVGLVAALVGLRWGSAVAPLFVAEARREIAKLALDAPLLRVLTQQVGEYAERVEAILPSR